MFTQPWQLWGMLLLPLAYLVFWELLYTQFRIQTMGDNDFLAIRSLSTLFHLPKVFYSVLFVGEG